MASLQVRYIFLQSPTKFYILLLGTYTLIHAFLLKHAHIKAARALKKSVKGSLILKDDTILEGPSLDDIIRSWNSRKDQEE